VFTDLASGLVSLSRWSSPVDSDSESLTRSWFTNVLPPNDPPQPGTSPPRLSPANEFVIALGAAGDSNGDTTRSYLIVAGVESELLCEVAKERPSRLLWS
jgi:hypothetical protein